MSATDHPTETIAVEALMSEIERYLAAVDAFRAEGCNPRWRPEPVSRGGKSGEN